MTDGPAIDARTDGVEARGVALARRIRGLVAGGTSPEVLFRTRRRLGAGAAPDVVVTALEQQARRLLPLSAPVDGEAGDAVLAWGEDLPAPVVEAWVQGGPLWLHHRGAPLTDRPHVAVVGTRIPTLDGIALAGAIAHDLARAGVVVVSGMARGIDQAAHRGALAADGSTIGVLGAGFDIDYPARTAALREAVAASGGLLSEHPAGHGVRHPTQFTARNRILVALSLAVVVVEAGVRSGALNSASWAADLGREVLVVPASPSNRAAAGSLALLREGATPVRGAADVLEVLGVQVGAVAARESGAASERGRPGDRTRSPVPTGLGPTAARLLPLLGPVPASPSALSSATDLPPRAVLVALSQLEEEGLIRRTQGGIVRS